MCVTRPELLGLLTYLDANVPHDIGSHVALTACQYGNDDAGWDDRLVVSVRLNGSTHILFVEDDDIEKGAESFARSIHAALTETSRKPLVEGEAAAPDME